MQQIFIQWTARTQALMREHAAALALALIAAAIVIMPNIMLWNDPGYQGIEMMMLDAENHYFARVHEVYEGHYTVGNTFLADKEKPWATPPLGEIAIALFGKIFGLDAARAAIVSKPISLFAITLLIYAFAFLLSRSRKAALIAAAFTIFGQNLITFSLAPVLDLLGGSPAGGPFLFFSRLVNPSISGIVFFGALALMFRALFEDRETPWWQICLIGVLVGSSLYLSPFFFSFLGTLLFISWLWNLSRRERVRARAAFFAGIIALVCMIPFVLNYMTLHALPEFETVARYLGVVDKREFVLGSLLPLMAALVALVWPRAFPRAGRTFILLACAAVFIAMNQQFVTGTMLQTGHYHWFITKPLAGIVAGLYIGNLIERFTPARFKRSVVVFVLGILIVNSMGFLAPWYAETRKTVLDTQAYAPLVAYLKTLDTPQIIWSDMETSDYIPIYTAHGVPNTINLGSYLLPQSFFDNRLFLEYRLRGIAPEDFESTIRNEAEYVSGRLWGLYLRELRGRADAINDKEFVELAREYKSFYAKPYADVLNDLGITMVAAHVADRSMYDAVPTLKERDAVSGFVIYDVLKE